MANRRSDHQGPNREAFEKEKKRLMKAQPPYCPICGKSLDYRLKAPDPYAPEVDHIIPLSRGGHPFDPANLQVVHRKCNQQKGDKLLAETHPDVNRIVDNRNLPWSIDWTKYDGDKGWPPEDETDES